jgi:hypothetical protein
MENKTPVKKVRLRDDDVFYVYDKRINKCAREGCCGTVKYGLNLKVQMPNGDTLNTYECNECHMKYTAYPNYVRLTQTRNLDIHNHREVRARDRKRREDARKQARNEKYQSFNKATKTTEKPHDRKYEKPYKKNNNTRFETRRYSKVTRIGGYQKSYEAVFGDDKRIAATD